MNAATGVRVRPLAAQDLDEVDRICRGRLPRGRRDFRASLQGVTMHRPNEAGYSTRDAFVIDDWR